jgi:choline dehydrogenase-like flavoprotein
MTGAQERIRPQFTASTSTRSPRAQSPRFGHDPTTAVLDVTCRANDLDNLYMVDTSFLPSSAALNPGLTVMANALRVGDRTRLGKA